MVQNEVWQEGVMGTVVTPRRQENPEIQISVWARQKLSVTCTSEGFAVFLFKNGMTEWLA